MLLIVIAVAAAVVTYTFVMGFVGTGTQSRGITGQLIYDAYSVTDGTDANITAYIRNTGGVDLIINAVYVDGTPYKYNSTATSTAEVYSGEWLLLVGGSNTANLPAASTGTLYINTNNLNAAHWHTVRLVCTDGTTLEFSVRK
ncbi:MAG: hypothetical protein H5T34_04025 [Candidatus Methanomethyliales bacterium]|nr:hypothetical protein [Candidatus Methanomethylicales archaeon]